MVTIAQAQQNVINSRQQIEQRRKQISKAEQNLNKTRQALPQNTQKQLRQITNSLSNRLQRQQVERVKKEIGQKESQLKSFSEGLNKSSQDVSAYENQIKSVQQQQANMLNEKRAMQSAIDLYLNKTITPLSAKGTPEYKYLKVLWANGAEAEAKYKSDIKKKEENIKKIGGSIKSFSPKSGTITYKLPNKKIDVRGIINSEIRKSRETRNTGMFQLVSASPTDLKTNVSIKGNGLGSITGNIIRVDSNKYNNNNNNPISGNNINNFKKSLITNYKQEIYNPKLNSFISASEPSGQATGIIRTATVKEQANINQANYSGSLKALSQSIPNSISNLRTINQNFLKYTPEGVILNKASARISKLASNIKSNISNRINENIRTKLRAGGLPTTPYYVQAYKKEANPFTSRKLGLRSILGIAKEKGYLTDSSGNKVKGSDYTKYNSGINVPTILSYGLMASPTGITTGIAGKGSQLVKAQTELQKANPELFVGLEKGVGNKAKLLINIRRKVGKVKSESAIVFDVVNTQEGFYQIQGGKGYTKVQKEMKFFSNYKDIGSSKFTFSGEARNVPAKIVKGNKNIKITSNINENINPIYSDIQLLNFKDNPQSLNSYGVGFQKTEGKTTKIISYPIENGMKLKKGELKVVDIKTGKEKNINVYNSPIARVKKNEIGGIGIIRNINDLRKTEGKTTNIITYPSKKISPKQAGITSVNINGVEVGNINKQILEKINKKEFQNVGTTTALNLENKLIEPISKSKTITKSESVFRLTGNAMIPLVSASSNIQKNTARQTIKPRIQTAQKSFEVNVNKQEFNVGQLNRIKAQSVTQEIGQIKTQQQGFRFGQIQQQKSKQQFKQRTKPTNPRPTRETNPKTNPNPFRNIKSKPKEKTKERSLTKEDLFAVFGKRYGKDILIEKVKTKKEAKKELSKFLTGTLGAGGFIEKGGKRIKVNLGSDFRPSRIEPKRVIQKRGKRLSSSTERKSIKSVKSGRLKWF